MPELAILIGLQASGKTTFYRHHLAGHVHVSKDLFPRGARRKQARQLRLISEALEQGRDVAVDNTNPSPDEWQPLITLGRRHGAHIIGYWFPPDVELSMRRNAARPPKTQVPDAGVYTTLNRLRRPHPSDGFDTLLTVTPTTTGTFRRKSNDRLRPLTHKRAHERKTKSENSTAGSARTAPSTRGRRWER